MIYVSIGNSDNKLTQAEWANYWRDVNATILVYNYVMHGVWHSEPTSEYQNACWGFELLSNASPERLKHRLGVLAYRYKQDTIAWAEAETTFVQPVEVS